MMENVVLRNYPLSQADSSLDDEELDALLPNGPDRNEDLLHAPLDEHRAASEPEESEYGFAIRALALLCACCLSVGSHYGSYILGPLKSRLARELGTSNAQFSLIVSAYSLNSTWTPLLGGLLVTRFGPAIISLLATSFVLVGLLILLIGLSTHVIWLMILGMFIFGLGTSPVSVAQESIIFQFFRFKGRGMSLALGLLAGKGSSFIAANTSFPLSEKYGPQAPFVVAVILALFSFGINVIYLSFSTRLLKEAQNSGPKPSKVISHLAAKKDFRFGDLSKLGDPFWIYLTMNAFCGAIWYPFIHLSANIIERRYNLSESKAGLLASLLLGGSIIFYPICGYLNDKFRGNFVVHRIFLLCAGLTLLCYLWLCLPPNWTHTPTPAMLLFGIGQGPAPLLLVLMVPRIVSEAYIPTALGAHKSIEQAGSAIMQTLAGLWLDSKKEGKDGEESLAWTMQILLGAFAVVNVLQLSSLVGLVWVVRGRVSDSGEVIPGARGRQEEKRGRVLVVGAGLVVVGAWGVFLTAAVVDSR